MPKTARRQLLLVVLALVAFLATSVGCDPPAGRPLAPRTQTFAELRVVRRGVQVEAPDEDAHAPSARERLVDGTMVVVAEGGLAWLRRDAGATLLVAGPARVRALRDAVEIESGRAFIDAPGTEPTTVVAGKVPLELARVRASFEVGTDGAADVYVLEGEVRVAATADGGDAAKAPRAAAAGEALRLAAGAGATAEGADVRRVVAWADWTGGLATTDRTAAPPPYGIGTVGARPAGDTGVPREPLVIQSLDLRVTVQGDFATTEVEQQFFNPASETVEGIYRMRLPEGASLEKFGVDRLGAIAWGYVKEKAAAAAQYQGHVYQGSTEDPALLQWVAPGVYEAKLYPLGPGASRRVVARWTEWLPRSGAKGERRLYVFPMAAEGAESSLPLIEEFTASIDVLKAGAREIRSGMDGVRLGDRVIVRRQDFVPRSDLAIELFDDGAVGARGVRAAHRLDPSALAPSDRSRAAQLASGEADYVLVPVRPEAVKEPEGGLDLAIVVDTSAATDEVELALARASVSSLLAHLGARDRVAVFAADDRLRPASAGSDAFTAIDDAARRKLERALAQLAPGGATDLGAVLAEAGATLDPARRGAVIYVGDGAPTVGERSLADLRARLAKAPRPVRTFALATGDGADLALLSGVAQGGFAARVTDGGSAARVALAVLELAERPALLRTQVDLGPSVERVYPRDLSALVGDESILLVGRLVGPLPEKATVRSPAGETTLPVTFTSLVDHGDLRRRWAEARLAEMLEEGAGRAALVDLGVRQGIVTPVTSFYVPTTQEMTPPELADLRRRAQRGELDRRAQERSNTRETAASVSEEEPLEEDADNEEGGSGVRASKKKPSKQKEAEGPGLMGRLFGSKDDTATDEAAPEQQNAPSPVAAVAATAAPSAAAEIDAPKAPAAEPPPPPEAPMERKVDDLSEVAANEDSPTRDTAPSDPWGDVGGLGLKGEAPGGGGRGEGIGLGSIGTIGHGAGNGTGQGFGSGEGRLGGESAARNDGDARGPTGAPAPAASAATKPTANTGADLSQRQVLDGKEQSVDGSFADKTGAGKAAPDSVILAKVAKPQVADTGRYNVNVDVSIAIGDRLLRHRLGCSGAANAPLTERLTLWRERLARAGGNPSAVANVYRAALGLCEAPGLRERTLLLSLLLDALPTPGQRVTLWRIMQRDLGVADVLYRGLLARVRTADEARALARALGLRTAPPDLIDAALKGAKDDAARAAKLRALSATWPDDHDLSLRVLDAEEDAGDVSAARALGRTLRRRGDVDARVRTAVGELHLRLAALEKDPAAKAAEEQEARRAFGEIVEFAPDDPAARRRLGDLLRSHGWFDEAARQYETLAKLVPDDPGVAILRAAAAEGLGKLEEAIKWADLGAQSGPPDATTGPAATARAVAATYLAWGQLAAREAKDDTLEKRLAARKTKYLRARSPGEGPRLRVVLGWSHPDVHPTLWSDTLGAAMPATEGDATLGIAQIDATSRPGGWVEIRLDPAEVERAARLGAELELLFAWGEGEEAERLTRQRVSFRRGGKDRLRFSMESGEAVSAPGGAGDRP